MGQISWCFDLFTVNFQNVNNQLYPGYSINLSVSNMYRNRKMHWVSVLDIVELSMFVGYQCLWESVDQPYPQIEIPINLLHSYVLIWNEQWTKLATQESMFLPTNKILVIHKKERTPPPSRTKIHVISLSLNAIKVYKPELALESP